MNEESTLNLQPAEFRLAPRHLRMHLEPIKADSDAHLANSRVKISICSRNNRPEAASLRKMKKITLFFFLSVSLQFCSAVVTRNDRIWPLGAGSTVDLPQATAYGPKQYFSKFVTTPLFQFSTHLIA